MEKKKRGMNLPDEDHVVRHVPWARLLKDEDDKVFGFLPQAFELRPDELALSVNWLEYFDSNKDSQILETVRAFRKNRDIGPNSKCAFGVGRVGEIKSVCQTQGTTVRIVFTPNNDNPAHSEIRYLPRDNLELYEAIASSAFREIIFNSEIAT